MKSMIRHTLAAALALAASTTLINAQDTGAPTPQRPREGGEGRGGEGRGFGRGMNPIIAALDANKDGEISAEELKNAEAALKTLDKNNDGKLSQDEYRPPMQRGPREGGEGGGQFTVNPEQMATRLMQFDKNADGKLTKDELPERMAGMLERGDTDKDGALSKDEIIALSKQNAAGGPPRDGDQPRRGPRDGEGPREGGDAPKPEASKPAAPAETK